MLANHHMSRAARALGLFCSPYSQSCKKIRDLGSCIGSGESEIRIAKARLTELGLQNRLLEFGIVWIPVDVMHGSDDF
jgi:hypothetical protein